VSHYSYVTQDLPPRWFARLWGHDVFPNALKSVLDSLSIRFTTLGPSDHSNIALPHEVSRELDDAVHSELVTYFLSDAPERRSWFVRFTERQVRKKSSPLYWDLIGFLGANSFERALIPNGRVPDQRLALLACQAADLDVEYYEIGRAVENSYYTGRQQIHDREATQNEVAQVTGHLSDPEIRGIADAWLETRTTTGLAIHPFGANWVDGPLTKTPTPSAPLAVFFSSSVDEFASYGGSWAQHTWDDQYQAFGHIMTVLESQGVHCVLRIHPNLSNKSRQYVDRELEAIRNLAANHPLAKIYSHTDSINSYQLVDAANYVIVGRSTLGLEASCMGKCVWTTTAARYDAIADVRPILTPEDATAEAFALWKVNPLGAQSFVAYWVLQDHLFRFGENLWATWDSLRPPLLMRIGNLFVRNSWAHRFHLVRLEWVKMRNRAKGKNLIVSP